MKQFSHFPLERFPGGSRRWKLSARGSALIIVLVMVVLLTVLMLAYLLNSAADRRLSNSSLNQTIADQLAYSAADVIIGDLKEEIVNPTYSTVTTVGPTGAQNTVSIPNLSSSKNNYSGMLPMTNSATVTIPNLVRISVRSDPIAAPGVASRASAASSSTASLNNRLVTPKRWNAHFLIPLKTPGSAAIGSTVPDSTPAAWGNFNPPDWVFVTSNSGPQVITTPSANVVGRYAYAIYDEGGLLDVNVAGTPNPTTLLTTGQSANKSSLALIDLTNLLDGNSADATYNQPLITASAENALVGWRNYASLQSYATASHAGPDSLSGQFPTGFTPTQNNATDFFFNFGRGNAYAYLKANYLSVGSNNITDQMFLTRQQLISMQYALQQTVGFSPTALQYLTTYSRGLDQPSYAPNSGRPLTATYTSGTDPATVAPNGTNTAGGADSTINPSFLTVRASSTATAARNDGSDITIGEPLVKKRFALNRLAWITYEGPLSDGSNVGTATTAAQVNGSNNDLQTIAGYLHDNYGLSYAFLSKGTAANIYKYFGLSWVTDTRTYGNSLYGANPSVSQKKWLYNHSNSNSTGPMTTLPTTGGVISHLQDLASASTPREPDFFELLKATIVAGSKGRTATIQAGMTPEVGGSAITTGSPDDFQSKLDSSLEFQTIQIGANIIEQSRLDGYPVQILYNDGTITATKEFSGTENLPYIYGLRTGVVQGAAPTLSNMPMPASDGSYQYTQAAPQPSPLPTLTKSGYNVVMQFPIVWNPHDLNSPRCATDSNGNPLTDSSGNALFPINFRIVADSTDPDDINPTGAGYGTFQLNAICSNWTHTHPVPDNNTAKVSLINTDTQAGTASFVAGGPFTSKTQWVNLNTPFYLSAESTALTFSIDEDPNSANYTGNAQYFFHEPTFLISPNVPIGSHLAAGGASNCLNPLASSNYPPTTVFPSLQSSTYMDTTGTAYGMTSGSGALFTTDNSNAGTTTTTNNHSLNLNPILGFYLGVCPGAYYWDAVTPKEAYQYTDSSGNLISNFKLPCPLTPQLTTTAPVTYRMQYQAPAAVGGGWMTYDAKYATSVGYTNITQTNYNNWTFVSGTTLGNRAYCEGYDPRTSRFSMPFLVLNGPGASPPGVFSSLGSEPTGYTPPSTAGKPWTINAANTATFGWLGGANASKIQDINSRVMTPTATIISSNEIMTMRPDIAMGFYAAFETTGSATVDTQFPLAQGWMLNNPNHAAYPGLLQINSPLYTPTPSTTYYETVTSQLPASVPNSPGGTTIDTSFLPNANGTLGQYYMDCDGVTRRAAGAYFTDASGTVSTTATPGTYPGLPLATAHTVQNSTGSNLAQQQVQSRPIILHRPFRSVAELGYVFSGTPFKHLDFFTPESGDCPLLDVFCIDDSDNTNGIVPGKVNLNTRQVPVLQTILTGAYKDEEASHTVTGDPYKPNSTYIKVLPTLTGATTGTEANLIATLLYKRTSGTGGTGPAWGPLVYLSDLVGRYVGAQGSYAGTTNATSGQAYDGFSSDLGTTTAFTGVGATAAPKNAAAQIQRFREAPIRALSAVGQTRVWNLLIDVIAQKGHFPTSASTLDNFYVDGEQRYWVHVAIDRLTGQVIDKQIEVVQQ